MALAVVGGALLSSFLNVLFDRMASHEFIDFFKTRRINVELLDELEMLLNSANGVLDDAEDRQITSPTVKNWLDKLRDTVYDADYLLDRINYEFIRVKIEAEQRATANSEDLKERMEEIVRRLKRLVKQIGVLGLKESTRKYALSEREPTTSVVDESDIFGRDADMEAILNLLQEDGVDRNAIGVIPIVGMGGIGKTILAQLVYNHSKAQQFQSRAWVCVSDNYDGFKIKKELLKQVSNSVNCDYLTSEQIDVELKKSLKDERYLLVLDDIWDDGYDNWDRLQAPLKSGARGSKIIVTTRSQNIASKMGTVASGPYELRELDADSCWQLFAKHAFKGGKGGERLESMGMEIARKCKGLPLAAKMLGDLLRGEHKVAKWEAILDSDLWELRDNKVLPALMLSYQHLSSHLKQCFAYCAIFPKGHQMNKEEIIQLWMAEGFLVQAIGGKKMEEFGEECFDELVSRSFIQESFDELGGSFFCMHDLINDLAQHISGEFIVRMEEERSNKIGKKTRHFSFAAQKLNPTKYIWKMYSQNEAQVLENISEGHIRTFLCLYLPLDCEVLLNQILKLRCLRALYLRNFDKMEELPDQIGDLKLLRYLNLEGTSVERLPESVCTLYNLQTLILCWCDQLVELPKDIGRLINLHCVDIRGTSKLQEMPLGMGNLKELRTLGKFIVGKQIGYDINELEKLHHLGGELSIEDLQNVVDTPKDILKNKEHLENLKLKWSSETKDSEHKRSVLKEPEKSVLDEHERSVLEGLQPYTSINKLSICGYKGTKFADWVGDSSYSNIASLDLMECKYCTSLPPLDELSSLEHLLISNCDAVVQVSMKTPLCSLKTLRIENMNRWEEWIFCEGNDSVKCGSLAKLEKLTISNCPELRECIPLEEFPKLKSLHVRQCKNLKSLAASEEPLHQPLTLLASLNIDDCPSLISFPKGVDAPNLTRLELCECRNLKSLPEDMHVLLPSLQHLLINFCDEIESFPGGLPASLQSLKIEGCDKLIGGRLQWGLQRLNALSRLSLSQYKGDDLDSFPEETLLPSTLTSLAIANFLNLKVINYKGLQHLTSFAELEIVDCPNLQCLPEQGLPPALSRLKICGCPILEERCEREKREGRSKISHISHIIWY